MNLKDRTRWAINYISAKNKLSNLKIAKRMGIKNDTVNSYRAKLANPKVDFIVKFCDAFGIDLIWFTKGDGEPFPGASIKYPEVCRQTNYEIARNGDRDTGIPGALSTDRGAEPKAVEEVRINTTEKSFRRLSELAGITIERGWKTNLSNFIGIPIGQISNSILRGRISKNLMARIEKKGFTRQNWFVPEENNGSDPDSQPFDHPIDAEMSFQKLAILAGIRIGQNWLLDLASFIGLDALEIRKAIRHNQISDDVVNGIEHKGFGRDQWVIRKKVAPDLSNSRNQPMKTNELLDMAVRILESGTTHATTFALNIETFHKAVAAEKILERQKNGNSK